MADEEWVDPENEDMEEDSTDYIEAIDSTAPDDSDELPSDEDEDDEDTIIDAEADDTIPDEVDDAGDASGTAEDVEAIDETEPDEDAELPTDEDEADESEDLDEDLPDNDADDPTDINDNQATLPCICSVKQGDTVMVAMRNGEPTVIGRAGWGDGIEADIASAAAVAAEAQAVADATNQHFFSDSSGVHVTEAENDATTDHNILINSLGILLRKAANYLVSITSSAIAFYDGLGVAASNIVAKFGLNGYQVGKDNQSHQSGDYHSWQMVDKEGDTYAHVSDLRDSTGYATINMNFVGDGNTKRFSLTLVARSIVSIKVNGTTTTAYTFSGPATFVTLNSAPSAGAAVSITFRTTSQQAKAYTMGIRNSAEDVGACSFAEGYNTTASGAYSHAEGINTTASGHASHAEGASTTASEMYAHSEGSGTTSNGLYAHAEGDRSTASATASHAEGINTIAASAAQTALGRYNVSDSTSTYAVIVGNGTANARSNALTVDWDGNVETAGNATVRASNIDRDGTPPSTNQFSDVRLRIVDVDDEAIAYYDGYRLTTGETGTRLVALAEDANGDAIFNTFRVGKMPDGTNVYYVTDPAAFREAINAVGWDVNKSTTVSQVITAGSGRTVSSVTYAEWGKVAMLSVTCSGFSASTGTQTVGTVVSGKRPVHNVYATDVTSISATYAQLTTAGALTVYWNAAPSTSTTYTIRFIYILA